MRLLKRSATIALLLFVGATVGLLIAQEVAPTDSVPGAEDTVAKTAMASEADAPVESPDGTATEDAPLASDPEAGGVEVDASAQGPLCVVDAIYFHNTRRCRTCRNIEDAAKAAIETAFADEVAAGRLRWTTIDMEKQQHYVVRYDLAKPTLVLVRTVDGEEAAWVALDEAWSLIRREPRFAAYVESETRTFLEACR